MMRIRRSGRAIGAATLFGTSVILGACDSSTAELVEELNAAREGCTEEMLQAGDEECVQMFEAYIDRGTRAMETYIGAVRSFEEALRRRGAIEFDTAGLGRAIGGPGSPSSEGMISPAAEDRRAASTYPYEGLPAPGADFDEPGVGGGRWSDMPIGREEPLAPVPPIEGVDRRSPGEADRDPRGEVDGGLPARRQAAGGRGVLLPPEIRLRRPWLDGGEATEPYVEEAPPSSATVERRLPPPEPAPEAEPYEQSPRERWPY